MSIRNTIIALVALVILGGLAFFVSRTPEPAKTHKLFDIKPADIHSIQLESPSRHILLRRASDKSWQMAKPILTRADSTVADEMAGAIANLQVVGTADPNPADLAPFGLQQPAVTVTITTTNGTKLPAIMVGKDAPVGSNSFIKLANDPAVLLVNSIFPSQVVKNTDDLRSHRLLTLKPGDVNRIVITRSDGTTFEFDKQNGKWQILKPEKYAADPNQITQLLNSITAARANEFVQDHPDAEALDKYGLKHPSATIALYGGSDNRVETLLFGFQVQDSTHNQTYARRAEGNQPICEVSDYLVKAVSHSFDEYRDKTVLPLEKSNIGSVDLTGGPLEVILTRGPKDKWTVSSGGKTAAADSAVVSSLLDQLHNLKGDSVAAPSLTDPLRFGMVKPNLIITVNDLHSKPIGTIKLSEMEVSANPKVSAEGRKTLTRSFGYAVSSTNPAVYQIEPATVTDFENTTSQLSSEAAPTPTPSPSPTATPAASAS
jgi:Domain of unknown function (DUF4340)